jgi:hypothetical protein
MLNRCSTSCKHALGFLALLSSPLLSSPVQVEAAHVIRFDRVITVIRRSSIHDAGLLGLLGLSGVLAFTMLGNQPQRLIGLIRSGLLGLCKDLRISFFWVIMAIRVVRVIRVIKLSGLLWLFRLLGLLGLAGLLGLLGLSGFLSYY